MPQERFGLFNRWRLYRRTVRHLSQLDNWLLADIGIDRSSVRSRALRAVIEAEER